MARYLLTALLALLAPLQPAAADTALLRVSPQTIQVGSAETLVEVTLEGVSGLYGLDIRLEFDPALLEVLDADDGKDGVQISPGQIPSPDFVVRNEADNAAGTLWYAATQMNPREPASGAGVVCSLRVRGVSGGAGELRVVEAKLVDRSGGDLATTTSGAQVTVALGASQATEDSPTATPTPQPTDTPTNTSTPPPTDEPTATPLSDEPEPTATQEPTATDAPADPDPTATNEPTATPTLQETATPTAIATPSQPEQSAENAYPAPSPTTVAPPTDAPVPTRTPTHAPAPSETPDPSPTAAEEPTATPAPVLPAAAAAAPAAPAPEEAAPPASETQPLLPPGLFSILLGLVAAAALALAVHLTRHDAPAHQTVERKPL